MLTLESTFKESSVLCSSHRGVRHERSSAYGHHSQPRAPPRVCVLSVRNKWKGTVKVLMCEEGAPASGSRYLCLLTRWGGGGGRLDSRIRWKSGVLGVDCRSLPHVSSPLPDTRPPHPYRHLALKTENENEDVEAPFLFVSLFVASRALGFYQISSSGVFFQPKSQKTGRGLSIHSLRSAPGDGLNLAG